MSRVFDGANDRLLSADNAVTGVNVAQKSWSCWILVPNAPGGVENVMNLLTANGAGGHVCSLEVDVPAVAGFQARFHQRGTTDGQWDSPDISVNARHHIAVTYDRGATTNDPIIYVDGVSVTVTEIATPVAIGTGEDTLKFGENSGGTADFEGRVENAAIDADVLWTAAEVNRSMWWGRPRGGLKVYMPFFTSKLVDEGASAETLTATGTTVGALTTPCVRPGSAMMGMGVGW